MISDSLARAERKADQEAMRDTRPVFDEYGGPTALLERVDVRSGPVAEPSYNALMAQAATITEIASDAKLVEEEQLRTLVARARLRRGGDVVARARNRQGVFARLR